MVFKIFSIIFGWATLLTGCTGIPDGLEPVSGFEPGRYLGKWYEIARLDHSFERNLSNVSAIYTRKENGDIRVQNKGFNAKTGAWKQIEGHARFLENEAVGSLKVSFFGPFYGGYHVIALDKEYYSYSMVAGPSRSYLWILSRTTTLDDSVYAGLVEMADGWGFDTKKLIKVSHNEPDDRMQHANDSTKENDKMMSPCPKTPNCVSSLDSERSHFVEPFHFTGSATDAVEKLVNIISDFKRARVVSVNENFIQAEFTSLLFRFVDDAEFFFDERKKIIHVKSASRIGYSDLGANRRRIENIRKRFDKE